ncbi:MAG: hypothetical protein NZ867_06825, partial [SAR324 cluster bacterium]|nr:hypothetical protein [SAR324 cluster bacterium]
DSLTPLRKRGNHNSFVEFWSIIISFVVTIANNFISKLVVSAKGHKIITDFMFKNVKKMVCKD